MFFRIGLQEIPYEIKRSSAARGQVSDPEVRAQACEVGEDGLDRVLTIK